MDESRYDELVSNLFKKMLAAVDELDPDVADSTATGDMLTITAASGEKCIVNTQRSVRQIWVAGKSQGVHFSYDDKTGKWTDDKGKGLELFAWVAEIVGSLTGKQITYH